MLGLLLAGMSAGAQVKSVTVSGTVDDGMTGKGLAYVNVVMKDPGDSSFIAGTVTDEHGLFSLKNIPPGRYILDLSFMGYGSRAATILVGQLSEYLDLGRFEIGEASTTLDEVVVTAHNNAVAETLDRKTYTVSSNISQQGGSLLHVLQNLPGVTVSNAGSVQLRGSPRVTILIDGKQTALTGFGNQAGLDNIPASAIERVEIINNPSARYDANGMAGIINIIMKSEKKEGLSGKAGIIAGVGALRRKRENLPTIRPQYEDTPKINPSLALNYRQKKLNYFLQGDLLSQTRLNKNEFSMRDYSNGDRIEHQYQENRTQTAITAKGGIDWYADARNSMTVSALYSREGHIDRGDLPYFNVDSGERTRLWQFYEDEVNTAVSASAAFQHLYPRPGHVLNISLNYTFHREDEKYFITNTLPASVGKDRFKLIADENVADLNIDYLRPLRHGRIEAGSKFRWRLIPTDMQFFPGDNSPMDIDAAGWATYREVIPALYSNYVFESSHVELEAGMRVEYVKLDYQVNPDHNTYKSDGYHYFRPFPNVRFSYILDANHRLSLFYNRRVDRPDEGDIRIFPKYDDPEILKVGNPGIRPQFTHSAEVGYKTGWSKGFLHAAVYNRITRNMITRVTTRVAGSQTLYSVMQNAGKGSNTGVEITLNATIAPLLTVDLNMNAYENILEAFTVRNQYPVEVDLVAGRGRNYSGSMKLNTTWHFPGKIDFQLLGIYLAPDVIPQGRIGSRYSIDTGAKKMIQQGRGELTVNATDLFGTMRIRKKIFNEDFVWTSTDYYETQIIRAGYSYKFGK